MASGISNIDISKLLPPATTGAPQTNRASLTDPQQVTRVSSVAFSAKNDPTTLILQSAMEKINARFTPYLGDGAIKKAIESGQDMSPKATAQSILSFATHIIGRAEAAQADLPIQEQRSRQHLFQNVQTGIEAGFAQARNILESMHALHGKTKNDVNSTYTYVQQGLADLSDRLHLQPQT